MPSKTKIVLSDKELNLVTNTDWILTKQGIISKMFELLNECISEIDAVVDTNRILNAGIRTDPPKISKGENYLGLPYVTLDHPRCFGKDIFAIRTMFWWGNFMSITLHIAGQIKSDLEGYVLSGWENVPAHFYLCIHEEQWHHHFESENYKPVPLVSREQLREYLTDRDFLKIAVKYELKDINKMKELLARGYQELGKILWMN